MGKACENCAHCDTSEACEVPCRGYYVLGKRMGHFMAGICTLQGGWFNGQHVLEGMLCNDYQMIERLIANVKQAEQNMRDALKAARDAEDELIKHLRSES
jgi:hypothetical protein